MKKFVDYFKSTLSEIKSEKNLFILFDAMVHFPQWIASFKKPTHDTDFIPWINFSAISFLKKQLKNNMNVFEYGSGSSTIFFAKRASQVVSIEHNPVWYNKTKEIILQYELANVNYKLILPEIKRPDQTEYADPHHYISSDKESLGKNFESYVKAIDTYPDNFFDVVMIDGRARPSCILHAIPKIKKGGYLIVDNTERSYYLQYFIDKNIFSDWEMKIFSAHVPGLNDYCKTTILKRH